MVPLFSYSVLRFGSSDTDAFQTFIFPPVWTPEKATEVVYKWESSWLRENVGHHMPAEDENKLGSLIS